MQVTGARFCRISRTGLFISISFCLSMSDTYCYLNECFWTQIFLMQMCTASLLNWKHQHFFFPYEKKDKEQYSQDRRWVGMLLFCEFKLKREGMHNGEVSKYWLNLPSTQDIAVLHHFNNSWGREGAKARQTGLSCSRHSV